MLFKNFFTKSITLYKTKYALVENKISSIQFPEKYKDTIIERWATYWKYFLKDYKDAVLGVRNEFRDKPVKSWTYLSLIALATYLAKNNPDETHFRDDLLKYCNEVLLVHPDLQNPVTVQHLTYLHRCYNEGVIRRLNFGICSFMWIHDYDQACFIYKSTCNYLKPEYRTLTDRIIDVGFLNRWWNLEKKIIDYDVNF